MTGKSAPQAGEDANLEASGLPASPGGVPALVTQKVSDGLECGEKPAQIQLQIILGAFLSSVERLEHVLDHETILLQQHKQVALDDFNHKKSQGLLEFSRTMNALRALDPAAADIITKPPLIRLRAKLTENLAIVQMHLGAVSSIAATIARVIQDHDSDGTYTWIPKCEERRR